MKSIKIRDLEIGHGPAKIIVSIVESSQEDIIKKASILKTMEVDLIEWRVDFYQEWSDISSVLDTLDKLREELGATPLIFTFRSKEEGGEEEISMDMYSYLNKEVARSGKADLIDLQIFSCQDIADLITSIHETDVYVIGSYHDFMGTPEKEEIISRLVRIQDMGADILKIALMAKESKDVLTLLDASNYMYKNHAKCPLITISMGPIGSISRIAGGFFGSSMTFASAGAESAPGQLDHGDLRQIMGIINRSM